MIRKLCTIFVDNFVHILKTMSLNSAAKKTFVALPRFQTSRAFMYKKYI
jgi:hypothetical protein